jgi:hypothetical protein
MLSDRARDRKFRHELFPKGPRLVHLAEAVISDLLEYERRAGVRQRARKPGDHAAMVNAVNVIVANLAHATLFPPKDRTAIILPLGHARGQQTGAVPQGFGKGLPATVEVLHGLGLLTLARPDHARLAATIEPTDGFRQTVREAGIRGGDIGRRVVLDRLRLSRRTGGSGREYLPVPDTPEACRFRTEMDTINGYLAGADIAYLGNEPVDIGDRMLVRHFNLPRGVTTPCLDCGGRLFGGFWQPMRKEQRQHIRIAGEPAVELDFGQVFPRLAYGLVGGVPPDTEDLYHLPELAGEYRPGVKKGFNALLYGTRRWGHDIAQMLPATWTASRLRKALIQHHPMLADLLQPGSIAGYRLMFLESSIMVAVLLACIGSGITALPIHDAVLAPASASTIVSGIMERESQPMAGVSIPVVCEDGHLTTSREETLSIWRGIPPSRSSPSLTTSTPPRTTLYPTPTYPIVSPIRLRGASTIERNA